MSRFTALDQCWKVMNDIPHDANCPAGIIGQMFACGCTWRKRVAVGLNAVILTGTRTGFERLTKEEGARKMLESFLRAATRAVIAEDAEADAERREPAP